MSIHYQNTREIFTHAIDTAIMCPCVDCERASLDRPLKSLNQRLRNSAAGSNNAVVRLSSTHNRRTIRARGVRVIALSRLARFCAVHQTSYLSRITVGRTRVTFITYRFELEARPFFHVGAEVTTRHSDTVANEKKNEEAFAALLGEIRSATGTIRPITNSM